VSHFAEIDAMNTVIRVLVVPDDQEHRGQEYLADDVGIGGTWIQTSYNTVAGEHLLGGTPLRGNYASSSMTYDPTRDVFLFPSPYPSWVLNETTYIWEPPTPFPDDGNPYYWDEDTTSWVEITE
jgi:hypothetical protein